MKKYKCKKCGYIIETDKLEEDYVCPICGASRDEFELVEDSLIQNDIEAIVESVIESANEDTVGKIINDNVEDKRVKISEYNPAIMRINEKCINCGQCRKTCENIENISYNLNICNEPICVGCGQCILNCPSGALVPKYAYRDVKEIINNNDKIVVALTSPAVRVSIGDNFDVPYGENVQGKLVTALKKVGFDYVFDTAFGADVTILEEVTELISRITNKGAMPQFTSCCPAWVKYAEIYHPELIDNISSCKSPIGMQCAVIKTYFAEKKGLDPSRIVTVAITPCTAKKMEAKEYVANIDYVLTASELSLMLKEDDINLANLPQSNYDPLLGESSGGGVMFGNTGGVMESALRTLYKMFTGQKPKADFLELTELRGLDGIKTSTVDINGKKVRVAVVNGIANLEEILKDDYYKKFHFIEVMNCNGGCIGGGGQPLCPIPKLNEVRKSRIDGLYDVEKHRAKRCSFENDEVKELYKEYLKKPLSEESLKILHTSYSSKSSLLEEHL